MHRADRDDRQRLGRLDQLVPEDVEVVACRPADPPRLVQAADRADETSWTASVSSSSHRASSRSAAYPTSSPKTAVTATPTSNAGMDRTCRALVVSQMSE